MTLAIHAGKANARIPHTRIEQLWTLAGKTKAVALQVARVIDGRQQLEIVLTMPYVAEDRTQIEQCVVAAQDESAALPRGINHPFVFSIMNEHGAEIARERIRFPGGAEPITRALQGEEADAAGITSGPGHGEVSKFHPRESASLVGIVRQQMRHNEALAGILAKHSESTASNSAKTIDRLTERVDSLTDRTIKQADAVINAAQQNRALEAQARRDEVETEAIRSTAAILAEYLPLGIHRIARKYGLAGDAELDPLIEKLVTSFRPEQIEPLTAIFDPAQKAMFIEMWTKAADRKAKREKDAAAKAKAVEPTVNKLTGTTAPTSESGTIEKKVG